METAEGRPGRAPLTPQLAPALLKAGRLSRDERLFLAAALLPMDSVRLLRCLTQLAFDEDGAVRRRARETLASLPAAQVAEACALPLMPAETLDLLVRFFPRVERVLAAILAHPAVRDRTVSLLATLPHPGLLAAIRADRVRLGRAPFIRERLAANPSAPRATPLAPEEFDPDAIEFLTPWDGAGEEEFPRELLEEGAAEDAPDAATAPPGAPPRQRLREYLAALPAGRRVALAVKGNSAVRRILVADKNRAVAEKVLENPMLTEREVEMFARQPDLSRDLLRLVAQRRDWVRRVTIATALVVNPRTPPSVSLGLLERLPVRHLRGVARNRNIPQAVRRRAAELEVERAVAGD